jgi:hypothetical protein
MPASHDATHLAALGREWIAAWNSRDLERVLKLYAEDAEMTSDKIQAFGFDSTGTLAGKAKLRVYWRKGLELLPDLHFTLICSSAPTASSCSTRTSAAPGFANICGWMRRARSCRARPTIWRIEAVIASDSEAIHLAT